VVGSGEVVVTWMLNRQNPESLGHLVRTEGYPYERLNEIPGVVQARFPPNGPARWEAWLDSMPESRVILVRGSEPTVRVGYRHGDGPLGMVEGDQLSLPSGPLTLEFFFDQTMDPKSLTRALDLSSPGWGAPADFWGDVQAQWLTPSHARWTLPDTPPVLNLTVRGFQDITGLITLDRPLLITCSETLPYLERVHLDTLAADRVMEMPLDIMEAILSPDGRQIGIQAIRRASPPEVVVADLAASRILKSPLGYGTLAWLANGELAEFDRSGEKDAGMTSWHPGGISPPRRLPIAAWAPVPSPGGSRVAYLDRLDAPVKDGVTPFPVSLVLIDLKTGQRQVIADFVEGYYFATEGDYRQWVAWSPDGQQIAALSPLSRTQGAHLVVYDLTKGTRRVVGGPVASSPWGQKLAWSPDGSRIYGTAGWVYPLDGTKPVHLLNAGGTAGYWDGSGRRLLLSEGVWGQVSVLDVATGARTQLGDGWPVGWDGERAYIIRWPASSWRYRWDAY